MANCSDILGRIIAYSCIIILLLFVSIFSLVALILGTKEGVCDNTDIMGLNVADYLLGVGIYGIISSMIAFCLVLSIDLNKPIIYTINIIFLILNSLFGLCWFIIGAIILFRSNIECIHVGVPYVCYAVFIWVLSAFNLCCRVNIKLSNTHENI